MAPEKQLRQVSRSLSRRDFLRNAGTGAASLVLCRAMGVFAADKPAPIEALYNEKYRPQFHFTPMKNWTNDPNGLVYYKGEYHLFFQHNPFGIKWGNMTWGHAVSKDLMHWKQLPHAIEPDELGTIFSGSAVIDWKNTSGFQTGDENVMVAFYTSAGEFAKPEEKPFTQSIAYSNDRGRTWVKYKNNPVIGNISGENDRDPKVIWHEPSKHWIMALFLDADDDFVLLSSKNLKQWKLIQTLKVPGVRECPDFFPLAVDGNPNDIRWVLWGGNGGYLLGSFDGKKFTVTEGPYQAVSGQYYAAQTYSDIPDSDGRRIQISWMAEGKFPGMPFNQQMSIPCEMKLRTTSEGVRLCLLPVKELKSIRGEKETFKNIDLKPGVNPLADVTGELFEIRCNLELGTASQLSFNLRGKKLVYDVKKKILSSEGGKDIKIEPTKGSIKLTILIDRASVEIFAGRGEASMFMSCPLDPANRSLEIIARDGQAKIKRLSVWQLKSTWPKT